MSKAPQRGSFPLDHFHECDAEAKKYSDCIQRHELIPKRCRRFQIQYLDCRMNSGLMEKEEMSDLGFRASNSWETEENQKKQMYNSILNLKKKSREYAQQRFAQKNPTPQ